MIEYPFYLISSNNYVFLSKCSIYFIDNMEIQVRCLIVLKYLLE